MLIRRNRSSLFPDAPNDTLRVLVDSVGNFAVSDENRQKTVIAPASPFADITANTTIDSTNYEQYNQRMLRWSAAYTVTLAAGLPSTFGFTARPPAAGNATIASANTSGLPTLDGVTTSQTRTLANNKLFAVQCVGTDAFSVTGS